MTTDTAAAKIGRSMKKCESFTPYASKTVAAARVLGQRQRAVFATRDAGRKPTDDTFRHRDLAAGPRSLHTADDDAVLLREPCFDHSQAAKQPPGVDDLLAHDTFGVDDVDDLPRLVGDDCLIGHEQRVERLQRVEAQLPEHARRNEPVWIGDDGAEPNRAGA